MKEYVVEYEVKGKVFARVLAESLDDAMAKALDHDVIDYDDMETDYVNPTVWGEV